jgi:hypothetical protein
MPGYSAKEKMENLEKRDILASTDHRLNDVRLATSTRDAGNGTPTDLRAGLVLSKIQDDGADDGLYKEFDPDASDGSQLSGEVVILMHDVKDIDTEERQVSALVRGDVKEKALIGGASVDWSECQRINVEKNDL